jgi:hypothetical protein
MKPDPVFELGSKVLEFKKLVLELKPNGAKIGGTRLKPHPENLQISLKCQN